MAWIINTLASAVSSAPLSVLIDFRIYVTRTQQSPDLQSAPQSPDLEKCAVDDKGQSPESAEMGKFLPTYGRPDVGMLVRDEIHEAAGPVSVDGVSCALLESFFIF